MLILLLCNWHTISTHLMKHFLIYQRMLDEDTNKKQVPLVAR